MIKGFQTLSLGSVAMWQPVHVLHTHACVTTPREVFLYETQPDVYRPVAATVKGYKNQLGM